MRKRKFQSRKALFWVEELEPRFLLSSASISLNTVLQTMAGFGASSAWITPSVTTSEAQLLWSPTNGAGLSILRSHINADTSSSSGEISTMQSAQQMGVTIFSTPWSPPAQWKSNNNVADIVNGVATGGYLLPADYQNYANWLAQYVINMKNDGITVYAVSMQNEPDWQASYESAVWSAQEFHDVLSILEPTFAADGLTTKIILPEETHWNSLNLVSQVMSDPTESSYANLIYADHTYGNYGFGPISGLNGHQIWETENSGSYSNSAGIVAGLSAATSIYDVVDLSGASAFNWWWINAGGSAGLLGGNWQSTKVFSAMANYSKFIRPGWVEVGESNDNNGLLISAFKNPATGEFASVLVNNSTSAISETISLNGGYAPVLTPWITSATLDVAQQQSIPATGTGSSYTYTIPAQSIVTLTGNVSATPVTEVPVGLLASATSPGSVRLAWTNNLTSATGYTLQRSSNGTIWSTLTSAIPAGSYTYTDAGLPANTQYYYRVQANNGTLYSNVATAMTQPPAPANLSASYSASTQNVTLTWTGNGSSVTNYAVDYSIDGGNTWITETAGITPGSTSYTDTSAPDLATVEYRVRAVYGNNSSAPTNVATVATTVLRPPSGLAVAHSGTTAVLTWNDNTTANATVTIQRSTDNINWTTLSTVGHGTQTYTDATVAEGVTYYYRVDNVYNSINSAYATASAFTVPPYAPTHVEVEFSPAPTLFATVLWDNNSAADTAYEVDRSTDGGNSWTMLTNTLPANSTRYTDTTVTSGQAYEYRVEALSNGAVSSSMSTLPETASALPAPYAHADIGDAGTLGQAGGAGYNSSTGTYTLTGAGADIWNTADGFQFAFTTLTGDGSYIAQVASMANFANYGKAGIMMRNSLDPSSAYAIGFLTPQGTLNFEQRTSYSASSTSVASKGTFATPLWLKLTRSGNAFSVYYGTNGTTWTQLGASVPIAMNGTIYVGMITSSHSSGQLATATFASPALTGAGNQPPTIATPAAAAPPAVAASTVSLSVLGADASGENTLTYTWSSNGPAPVTFSTNGNNGAKNTMASFTQTGTYNFTVTVTDQFGLSVTSSISVPVSFGSFTNSIDIGSPGFAGSMSYSSSTYTLTGGGSDIWNAADQFHFVYQSMPGDGAVMAQVKSQQNTDPWAKAGVMMRASTDPNAANVGIFATPGNGVSFQWRSTTGGTSNNVAVGGLTVPVWVKLTRVGNTFSGYYSTNGITWTQVGTSQTISLPSTALVGLAVTAHNKATASTATFSGVSVASLAATALALAAPGAGTTGTAFAITVSARNTAGAVVHGYVGSIILSTSDPTATFVDAATGQPLAGGIYAFVTADAGQHQFLVTEKTAGTLTISATATGLTGATTTVVMRGLIVTNFTPTPTGFGVSFSKAFIPADVSLYRATLAGVSDVILTGAHVGPIHGALIISSTITNITFSATQSYLYLLNSLFSSGRLSAVLPDDTYTLRLVSGASGSGFLDALGAGLDGANNGGAADFVTTFSTSYQVQATPVLAMPDFARGPNASSPIEVPNGVSAGIPITLYNAANVTSVTFSIAYNPALLTIESTLSGTTSDATDPAAALKLITNTGGLATFQYNDASAASLTPSNPLVLGDLIAVVPNTAANLYETRELLQLSNVIINGTQGNAVSAGGLHVNAYLGDVNGDGKVNGLDKLEVNQVAIGAATGFNAYAQVDPVVIGDVAGDISVDAGDVSTIDAYIVQLHPTQIPPVPGFVVSSPQTPVPQLLPAAHPQTPMSASVSTKDGVTEPDTTAPRQGIVNNSKKLAPAPVPSQPLQAGTDPFPNTVLCASGRDSAMPSSSFWPLLKNALLDDELYWTCLMNEKPTGVAQEFFECLSDVTSTVALDRVFADFKDLSLFHGLRRGRYAK